MSLSGVFQKTYNHFEKDDLLSEEELLLLENYSLNLPTYYLRLYNGQLNNNNEIFDSIIPGSQDIDEPLSDEVYRELMMYVYEFDPYISIKLNVTAPLINFDSLLEEGKKLMVKNEKPDISDFDDTLLNGAPELGNRKIDVYMNIFNLKSPSDVYVSRKKYLYSKYFEEMFVNTFRKHDIDVLSSDYSNLNVYFEKIFEMLRNNVPLEDMQLEMGRLLIQVMRMGKVSLADDLKIVSKNMNVNFDTIMERIYRNLRQLSLNEGGCDVIGVFDEEYINDYVLKKIQGGEYEFSIDSGKSNSVYWFLSAFPYHKFRNYSMKTDTLVVSNVIEYDDHVIENFEKYKLLHEYFNLNKSYRDIVSYCKVLNFSRDDGIRLLPLVLNFRGYVCNFLAALVCKATVPLFNVKPKKMYYWMQNINSLRDQREQEENMCRYLKLDKIMNMNEFLSLSVSSASGVDLKNLYELSSVFSFIKRTSSNVNTLYVICGQYSFPCVLLIEYYRRGDVKSLLDMLIFCRLLLNVNNLNSGRRSALKFYCEKLCDVVVFEGDMKTMKSYYYAEGMMNVWSMLTEKIEESYTLEDLKYFEDTIANNLNKFELSFFEQNVF